MAKMNLIGTKVKQKLRKRTSDYDFLNEGSDNDGDIDYGNDSSDDDDLKRVLRHIGGIHDEMDFEAAMEKELSETLKSIETDRKGGNLTNTDILVVQDTSENLPSSSSSLAAIKEPATASPRKKPKTVRFNDEPAKFYDDAYFDSDDEEQKDSANTKQRKKHPVVSDDDLFYDPKLDEEDQAWVDDERRQYQPKPSSSFSPIIKSGSPKVKKTQQRRQQETGLPNSDAVLNCPACMTTLCLDCQRHELYNQQYRAMFVKNCVVDKTQTLNYKPKKQAARKRQQQMVSDQSADGVEMDVGNKGEDSFHPVKCMECTTEVGVMDKDEVYHFFNVIASHT